MTDERTAPMQQPQWARRDVEPDDQETIMADQDSPTPPTMPAGGQGPGRWDRPADPGFVRTAPADLPTPPPYQQPQTPYPPPPRPAAGAPGEQTMLISEQKPTPVFAWLVVVDGPDRNTIGQVHPLQAGTSTLGRTQGNHIVVRDETCSAQHARIRIEDQEGKEPAFVLYDMGSRNGTYIGSKESYKDDENRKYRHKLQDGDYLLVGETTLVFKKL